MQTQIQGDFRRKSNTACGPCKKRKIRCDRLSSDSTEQPCSACRRHGWDCAVFLDQDGPAISKRQRLDRHHRPRTENGLSGTVSSSTVDIASPPAASIPDESPVSISHPSLASADSLKDFYERGIGSDWEVFARAPDKDPLRIVYTGSAIANLNQLVQPSSYALHLPFPSIRPRLDWEPIPGSRAYLTSAVARDLSSLPARHIRDSLIDTYFTFIHPGLPIIDAVEFQAQYASANPSPPLLLLQCMLLAAARVSTHPEVAASRNDMTATIYRRAKALFEMRHENDRVLLVQSALLLTWHVEDADSVSNGPYYWTGLATRIALGLAMHRDLSDASASRMPAADRRLYRHLWWTTLRFEVYTALEYGRPSMIRAEDFDQPALEPGDFLCGDGSNETLACPEFCILDARLCILALDIIRLAAPGTISLADEAAAIDQQLVLLAAELPSTLDFWSCQLRITHNMLIIMLHPYFYTLTKEPTKNFAFPTEDGLDDEQDSDLQPFFQVWAGVQAKRARKEAVQRQSTETPPPSNQEALKPMRDPMPNSPLPPSEPTLMKTPSPRRAPKTEPQSSHRSSSPVPEYTETSNPLDDQWRETLDISLLGLPLEVRDWIYRILLSQPQKGRYQFALFCVCTQVRREILATVTTYGPSLEVSFDLDLISPSRGRLHTKWPLLAEEIRDHSTAIRLRLLETKETTLWSLTAFAYMFTANGAFGQRSPSAPRLTFDYALQATPAIKKRSGAALRSHAQVAFDALQRLADGQNLSFMQLRDHVYDCINNDHLQPPDDVQAAMQWIKQGLHGEWNIMTRQKISLD
ncbi:hypothetical protein PRZ48_008671 [Zasmidium cellare]|uniref:Zn(2)-C6 fungal-type domain-containing protein n=1 Tax=Zasmidium cellare TaxID=395010 RepID=A0ABR0EG58_ZASCE|nr:hypothetical protein PRZ48_008671 [Zasmidium cellare]